MIMSNSLVAALVFIAICIFVQFVFSKRGSPRVSRYLRVDLFNSSEHAFLLSLRREAPAHIAVLAKVRVSDLITAAGRDIAALNRIQRKHVDFVLYHVQTRSVLAAVELDGPTHSSERSKASDKVKNTCFASARVRLIRVPVAGSEKPETARALFREFAAESDVDLGHVPVAPSDLKIPRSRDTKTPPAKRSGVAKGDR